MKKNIVEKNHVLLHICVLARPCEHVHFYQLKEDSSFTIFFYKFSSKEYYKG